MRDPLLVERRYFGCVSSFMRADGCRLLVLVSSGWLRGLVGVLSRCFGATPGAVGGVVARACVLVALLVGACFLVWSVVGRYCMRTPTPTACRCPCFRWERRRSCRVAQAARTCAVWDLPVGYARAALCGPLVASRSPGDQQNTTNPHPIALGPPPISCGLHGDGFKSHLKKERAEVDRPGVLSKRKFPGWASCKDAEGGSALKRRAHAEAQSVAPNKWSVYRIKRPELRVLSRRRSCRVGAPFFTGAPNATCEK